MIDFEAQTVTAPDGATHRSEIDPGSLGPLLKGQDDINLILMYAKAIETFEYRHLEEYPGAGRPHRSRIR